MVGNQPSPWNRTRYFDGASLNADARAHGEWRGYGHDDDSITIWRYFGSPWVVLGGPWWSLVYIVVRVV